MPLTSILYVTRSLYGHKRNEIVAEMYLQSCNALKRPEKKKHIMESSSVCTTEWIEKLNVYES